MIQQLLQKNPSKRLGNAKGGVTDICKHKWFGAFDWKGLLRGTIAAPYVPSVDMLNPKAPSIDADPELEMVRAVGFCCYYYCYLSNLFFFANVLRLLVLGLLNSNLFSG